MTNIRLFYALPLADETRAQLVQCQKNLAERAGSAAKNWRFAREGQLHVTLAFLGDTPQEQVPFLVDAAQQTAMHNPPSVAPMTALCGFPRVTRATVLVVLLDDPEGQLIRLARTLSSHLRGLGLPGPDRDFRPHITLARMKHPTRLEPWLSPFPLQYSPVRLDRLRLCSSDLGPQGAIHSTLYEAPLAGAEPITP